MIVIRTFIFSAGPAVGAAGVGADDARVRPLAAEDIFFAAAEGLLFLFRLFPPSVPSVVSRTRRRAKQKYGFKWRTFIVVASFREK